MRQARRLVVVVVAALVVGAFGGLVVRALVAWFVLVLLGVIGGIVTGRTRLMGKRDDGSFPWWSLVVWAPWHAISRALAAVQRRVQPPGASEVADGLWVGAWPLPGDVPVDVAVVDMTAELPLRIPHGAYFCAPTWDHTAPTVDDVERAVQFALLARLSGRPLLVHCAHGRGRSALVACAVLVASGEATTPDDAYAAIKQRRYVRMNREQQAVLAAWAASRGR